METAWRTNWICNPIDSVFEVEFVSKVKSRTSIIDLEKLPNGLKILKASWQMKEIL